MKLNLGPLYTHDADIVLTFLQKFRGVKVRRGETISVPHHVLEIIDPSAWYMVFKARPSETVGILNVTRGFRVHGVNTIPAPITKQLIVELDIEYEPSQEDARNTTDAVEYLKGQPDEKSLYAEGRTQSLPSSKSTQVGGDHYSKMKIQPIDFITENGLGYIEGNIIKYVCRYKDKNGLEDLKKAQHYLQMLIEQEEHAK